MRRTKGFTLVELLVVIGIIALLVSILMPALGRARELAKRIQCASQLNGIGKAIMMYQNEYGGSNPRAWKKNHPLQLWGFGGKADGTTDYNAPDLEPEDATRIDWASKDLNYAGPDRNPQTAGSCLYLLVKREDVDPKVFICPSAPDDRVMGLDEAIEFVNAKPALSPIEFWDDLNDFGFSNHLSYSYNDPWNRLLDSSASASLVLAADKNQAFDYADDTYGFTKNPATGGLPKTGDDANIGTEDFGGTWDDTSIADGVDTNPQHHNSRNHQTEIQNVLFADTHVKKYNTPCVGVAEDNIFTYQDISRTEDSMDYGPKMIGTWGLGGSAGGSGPDQMYDSATTSAPSEKDSYLGN
ncbi:MAG: type II secretion system protein [Sedimentisphaerales bacterium]|nr:type II secretion system protein [Sedimentisphaerales bacterium]